MPTATILSVVRDQPRPRKLGRYELEECLGSEGGLETYRARVRGLAGFDRIFAVKCLRRRRGGPINLNDPFIRSAKRTAGITDPRVARVLDADVIDGVAIAVTEFVHGMDLDRFRECAQVAGVLATGSDEAAIKWQKIVAYIGSEAAGGLAATHALTPPLAHGSLTPRNLFASARGAVKVLDVGLRWTAQKGGEVSPNRVVGYAAPELSTAEANPMADMLSLGAVLFELATGELPPRGAANAVARKILDSLWPSMADFIAGLLADDPAVRPTAAEAAKILAEHWSDIPDASMVAEMTALVRNFSAFVADASLPKTDAPVPMEPSMQSSPAPEELIFSPPPSLRSDSSSAPPVSPDANPLPSGMGMMEETEALIDDQVDEEPSQEQVLPAVLVPSGLSSAPSALVTPAIAVSEAVLVPELEEWGARALAALGDQAGVTISPVAAPPARPSGEFLDGPTVSALPPVDDSAIEEAFAFVSATPDGAALLTDEQEATTVTPNVFEEASVDDSPAPPAPAISDRAATAAAPASRESEAQRAFMAVAFPEEPAAAPPSVFEEPQQRSAQTMAASAAEEERRSASRSAVKSPATRAAFADSEEVDAGASPLKRVLLLVALALAAVGMVGGVTSTFGVWGSRSGKGLPPVLKHAVPGTAKATPRVVLAPQAAATAVSAQLTRAPKAASVFPAELPARKVVPTVPAAVVAPGPSSATTPGKPTTNRAAAGVTITSNPAGATVWVDGEERGTTPLLVKAKGNQVQVVLVRAGYLAAQSILEVKEGAKVEETLKPAEPPMTGEARFRVECKTLGKLPIVVDGHQTGILCPFSKMRVEPGVHRVGVLVPATGKIHEKEITLGPGVRSISLGD